MDEKMFIEKQIAFLDEIIIMHGIIKDIHKSLNKLYPIAIVNNGYFFVFEPNEIGNKYEFKLKEKIPMPFSGDIFAAFPPDFYEMKSSAVISKNILENKNNFVSIFHEFVHCFQMENGEFDIKNGLSIAKQEMGKNNYSWEINYPFPYDNEYFKNKTIELSDFFANGDYENVNIYHKEMKAHLQETEFEYLIWQEWKEGFARYIENLINAKIGSHLNTNVLRPPFDRVHFYEIGSNYIKMLIMNDKELENNILDLFHRMKDC